MKAHGWRGPKVKDPSSGVKTKIAMFVFSFLHGHNCFGATTEWEGIEKKDSQHLGRDSLRTSHSPKLNQKSGWAANLCDPAISEWNQFLHIGVLANASASIRCIRFFCSFGQVAVL